MKILSFVLVCLVIFSSVVVYGQTIIVKEPKPIKEPPAFKGEYGYGYIAPPYDIPKVKKPKVPFTKDASDPAFTWEDHGGVTGVKDQSTIGTCWIFGSIATFESRIELDIDPLAGEADYSEQDVGNCNANGNWDGGNTMMVANHLTRFGSVTELDEPYSTNNPPLQGTCNSGNLLTRTVRDWRYLGDLIESPTDVVTIKNYLSANGPMTTSMSVDRVLNWDANFDSGAFDGNTVVPYLSGATATDHCVVIVGWDDNKSWSGGSGPSSGYGAWRVKNSWSSLWGDSGYFWIAYGSALIGSNCGYYEPNGHAGYAAKKVRSNETLLHYDEQGWQGATLGYSSPTHPTPPSDFDVFGLAVFTPSFASGSRYLLYVCFWNSVPGAQYEISVYDTFSGGSLSSELTGGSGPARPTGTCDSAGYYSVLLSPAIQLTDGDDISIVVNYTDPSSSDEFLLPYETQGASVNPPTASGNTYISADGNSWSSTSSYGDMCIRGIMSESSTEVDEWMVY